MRPPRRSRGTTDARQRARSWTPPARSASPTGSSGPVTASWHHNEAAQGLRELVDPARPRRGARLPRAQGAGPRGYFRGRAGSGAGGARACRRPRHGGREAQLSELVPFLCPLAARPARVASLDDDMLGESLTGLKPSEPPNPSKPNHIKPITR